MFSSGVFSHDTNVRCGIETVSEDVDTGGVAWTDLDLKKMDLFNGHWINRGSYRKKFDLKVFSSFKFRKLLGK